MKKVLLTIFAVAGGLLLGYGSILLEYTRVRPFVLIIIALVFGLGGALFAFLKCREHDKDITTLILWIVLALVGAGLGAPGAAVIVNYHTAMMRSETEQMTVAGLSKGKKTVRTGRRGTRTRTYDVYHARLVDSAGDTIYVPITAREYRSLHRGEEISVEQGRGIFGWKVNEVLD